MDRTTSPKGTCVALSRRSHRRSLQLPPLLLKRTHPTWPSPLVPCLPRSTLRTTRPRVFRLFSTRGRDPSPCLQVHNPVVLPRRPPSNWTVLRPPPLPGCAVGGRPLENRRHPIPMACHSRTFQTSRARGYPNATAHEAPRLDTRRDSVPDHDRFLGLGSSSSPRASPHQLTTQPMTEEAMIWRSTQPHQTPSHLDSSASHHPWTTGCAEPARGHQGYSPLPRGCQRRD